MAMMITIKREDSGNGGGVCGGEGNGLGYGGNIDDDGDAGIAMAGGRETKKQV